MKQFLKLKRMNQKKRTPTLDNKELQTESIIFGMKSNHRKQDPSISEIFQWKVNDDHHTYSKKSKQNFSVMGNYARFKSKIDKSECIYISETKEQFRQENLSSSYLKRAQKAEHNEPGEVYDQPKSIHIFSKSKLEKNWERKNCIQKDLQSNMICICNRDSSPKPSKNEREAGINNLKLDKSFTFGAENDQNEKKNSNKKKRWIQNVQSFLIQKSLKKMSIEKKNGNSKLNSKNNPNKISNLQKIGSSPIAIFENQPKISRGNKIGSIEKGTLIPGLDERIKQLHGLTRFLPDSTVQFYLKKPAFQNYGRNSHLNDDSRNSLAQLKTHNANPVKSKSIEKNLLKKIKRPVSNCKLLSSKVKVSFPEEIKTRTHFETNEKLKNSHIEVCQKNKKYENIAKSGCCVKLESDNTKKNIELLKSNADYSSELSNNKKAEMDGKPRLQLERNNFLDEEIYHPSYMKFVPFPQKHHEDQNFKPLTSPDQQFIAIPPTINKNVPEKMIFQKSIGMLSAGLPKEKIKRTIDFKKN